MNITLSLAYFASNQKHLKLMLVSILVSGICKLTVIRVVFRLKMVAFKCYGHPRNCLQNWKTGKENSFFFSQVYKQ